MGGSLLALSAMTLKRLSLARKMFQGLAETPCLGSPRALKVSPLILQLHEEKSGDSVEKAGRE